MTTAEQTVTYDELLSALDKATDVAVWLSGSDDYAPQGRASEGWQNVMRPKLWEALDVLRKAQNTDTKGES